MWGRTLSSAGRASARLTPRRADKGVRPHKSKERYARNTKSARTIFA